MTRAEIFTLSVRSDPDDADFVKSEAKGSQVSRRRLER